MSDRLGTDSKVGADIHVLDLEDGVPATEKAAARDRWTAIRHPSGATPLGVRINSIRTRHGVDDLAALLDAPIDPKIVVLPRVETPHDAAYVADVLSDAGKSADLWALIETGSGVLSATEIARSSSRLIALTFGAADFAADVGVGVRDGLVQDAAGRVAFAARAAGLQAIDAPTFEILDDDALRADCQRALELGFTGKVAIHPRQVATINAAFATCETDVQWAKDVIAAFARTDASFTKVDGVALGPPFLRRARQILRDQGANHEGR